MPVIFISHNFILGLFGGSAQYSSHMNCLSWKQNGVGSNCGYDMSESLPDGGYKPRYDLKGTHRKRFKTNSLVILYNLHSSCWQWATHELLTKSVAHCSYCCTLASFSQILASICLKSVAHCRTVAQCYCWLLQTVYKS